MLYQNTQQLLDFLKKNNLWNKKSLGQNFLVNPQIIETITQAANLTSEDKIVEIGPGLGILTEALLEKTTHVKAIEFDQKLIPILKETFKETAKLELVLADALIEPLPNYDYKLVANIPYYITSPLLNHYLQPKTENQKRPLLIVLLVQKEVAEKICSKAGDHSVLSLQVQIFGTPSIIGYVTKENFFPQPQVDSAILKIMIHPEPLIKDIKLFLRIIKMAFAQRRKTILNSLGSGLHFGREQTLNLLKNAGIEETRRPQTLSIQEWQKLSFGIEEMSQ